MDFLDHLDDDLVDVPSNANVLSVSTSPDPSLGNSQSQSQSWEDEDVDDDDGSGVWTTSKHDSREPSKRAGKSLGTFWTTNVR